MKPLNIALAAAVALGGMTFIAVDDASAQRVRADSAQSGVRVRSLFSADREIDCSLARGVSRFCVGLRASPRQRLKDPKVRARHRAAARANRLGRRGR